MTWAHLYNLGLSPYFKVIWLAPLIPLATLIPLCHITRLWVQGLGYKHLWGAIILPTMVTSNALGNLTLYYYHICKLPAYDTGSWLFILDVISSCLTTDQKNLYSPLLTSPSHIHPFLPVHRYSMLTLFVSVDHVHGCSCTFFVELTITFLFLNLIFYVLITNSQSLW